jgi:hypothetical protein
MVIDRIHLGPVVFAKTLAASIAARQSEPPASSGCAGVKHGVPRRRGSQLWPTLVEICYFQKGRKGLPRTHFNNQER